jgi:hypothetical protein
VKEIPHFVELGRTVGPDDLVILGLNEEERAVLKPFVTAQGMNYPVASLSEVNVRDHFSEVRALPTTFFLDREKIIRKVLVGYHDTASTGACVGGGEGKRAPGPRSAGGARCWAVFAGSGGADARRGAAWRRVEPRNEAGGGPATATATATTSTTATATATALHRMRFLMLNWRDPNPLAGVRSG